MKHPSIVRDLFALTSVVAVLLTLCLVIAAVTLAGNHPWKGGFSALAALSVPVLQTFAECYFRKRIGAHQPDSLSPIPQRHLLLYWVGFSILLCVVSLFRLPLEEPSVWGRMALYQIALPTLGTLHLYLSDRLGIETRRSQGVQ